MARKDKILDYVKEKEREGTTTTEIAEALQLQRSNVSKDLNILVREGVVRKTSTRPVRYFLAEHTVPFEKAQESIEDINHIFDTITGKEGSMRTPIEQAKSSILYPPKGLNCLITGQTGTGKTLFVHTMFQFAKANHLIDADKKLTVFNCADYANNTELLMSHLFGYAKGAFTGAEKTTDGLIQQADGGMLFLDEVHRLPPEGQEMIFYFMDHGTYSRLGEVDKKNHADVRIVCATTDDPNSSLLATFTRRIPITIHLPNYHDRPAREQINLLKNMLQLEATRINRNFELSEEVAKALIGSVEYGNVGQLKSNVQLVCARGFLNYMDKETIPLTMELLSPAIKDGLVRLKMNQPLYVEIARHLERQIIIRPNEQVNVSQEDAYELPYNLYDLIDKKAAMLRDEGMDKEAINNFIMTDINIQLKSFYQNESTADADQKLKDIVDPVIIEMTNTIQHQLETQYEVLLASDFVYAMSLHLSSFIKRLEMGEAMREVSKNILEMVQDYPKALEMAHTVQDILEEKYQLIVPKSELYYLAMLLISLQYSPQDGKIGVLVATHGNSTATSMVQVVSKLLNVDHLASFDMSLDMSPTEALSGICNMVKQIDRGSGVLLLVDMGSLATFNQKIIDQTGIKVRTIDMVTTSMVLEAGRKTSMVNAGLENIYEELQSFRGYSHTILPKQQKAVMHLPKTILSICATGEGTAKTIETMLNDLLVEYLVDDVEVISLSMVDLETKIKEIEKTHHIIATVGGKNPLPEVPHLTLEKLLQGGGEAFIQYLSNQNDDKASLSEHTDEDLQNLIQKHIGEYYTFINPQKIAPILWEYTLFIEQQLSETFSSSFKINLVLHLAGAIERLLTKETVSINTEEKEQLLNDNRFDKLKQANLFLEEHLNLSLPNSELYYLIQLIDTESRNTN